MEINIETQQKFLAELGSIDGRNNAITNTIDALYTEQEQLANKRRELLPTCQHVDDEGNVALSGGSMFIWCQICGKLLTDAEVELLEQYEENNNKN